MKAARLYAQVLVDAASATGAQTNLDSAKIELNAFGALLIESPLLDKVLSSPTVTEDEKQKVVTELAAKENLSPLIKKFLSILIKRNRMDILNEIAKEIEAIQIEKTGGLVGEIVSAIPLDAGISSGVAQAISKKLNRPVQLKERVDPGVIAGMRVTISGVTYDGSVQNKIEKLMGSFI